MNRDDTPPFKAGETVTLDQLERDHVQRVVGSSASLGHAARWLGIDQATLYRKRRRWQLTPIGSGRPRKLYPELGAT